MNEIGYSFYLIFTGNIMFSWGLLDQNSIVRNQKVKDIFLLSFWALSYSIVFNLIFSLVLVPMKLLSLSPVLCALMISFGFFISQTVQKIRLKDTGIGAVIDAPWLKNSLLFIVISVVSSSGASSISGFIMISAAALFGYFCSSVFLDAIIARIQLEPVSHFLKGLPIRLISAGLIALAFSGIDVSFFIQLLN